MNLFTTAACFPFDPQEKCTTSKDILAGFSSTLSFNLLDFPDPGIFKKKIQVPDSQKILG